MRTFVLLSLTALLVSSCAAPIPYSTDFPMTQSVFHSRDGRFQGQIPVGWFSSTEDTLAPSLSAWLIREDYSATLTIRELRLDRVAAQEVADDGLTLLASLNASSEKHLQFMREVKEFRLKGKPYCGYEFGPSATPGRAVVFLAGGKFYACTAQTLKGSWSKEEYTALFNAQQSVLLSLQY